MCLVLIGLEDRNHRVHECLRHRARLFPPGTGPGGIALAEWGFMRAFPQLLTLPGLPAGFFSSPSIGVWVGACWPLVCFAALFDIKTCEA